MDHCCLLYDGLWPISSGRGEMADAADLSKHECANRETGGVELLKVGETRNGNPEPSLEITSGKV